MAGIAAGTGVGVVVLALIAVILRVTSLKLPLRPFFQVTGVLLFAMAVVFAGQGVFELQVASVLKATQVGWVGNGVPTLGVHPTVQGLAVQGLLLAGALFALLANMSRTAPVADPAAADSAHAPSPSAPKEPVEARA
jgi:high-affinity iron transporter